MSSLSFPLAGQLGGDPTTSPRGHLVPRINEIMDLMNHYCPPQRYPADSNRTEEEDPNGWLRGGTSPSGQDFGDTGKANWFIGDTYLKGNGCPQRIVWLPPGFGEETFDVADSSGPHLHRDSFGGGDQNMPPSYAYRKLASRVMSLKVDLWANDYDDLDILVHWMTSAVWSSNAGAIELRNRKPVGTGGMVALEAGQRGLRYQLQVFFAFPVIAPWTTSGSNFAGPGTSATITSKANLSDEIAARAAAQAAAVASGADVTDPADENPDIVKSD